MSRGSKKPQMDDTAEVPISSMIDVVFLLIIFFVVTAAVDKDIEDEAVILAEAPHGKPVTKKDPRSIVINVHQDGVMTMGLNDNITREQISRELKTMMAQYAEKGIPAEDIPIIIRGDYHAQHGFIKQAMDAVTDTGLYTVKINAMLSE